ncbi:MAG: BofC C-terminal domain-containing protein [Clostridia bacterium]|nr:BofC C-terminal domain-containing protein [Clostridia bacterium]
MSKFNKVILIMVSFLVVLTAIITAVIFSNTNKREEANEKKETKVSEVILDECTEEYEMLQNKAITTSTSTSKKVNESPKNEEQFILKEVEGKIVIYTIEKNGEEKLFEKTEISTEYLPKKDRLELEQGIKLQGKEELNQFIENFE